MSIKVKDRLAQLHLQTDHELRVLLDKLIEETTGKYCDTGVDDLSDEQFLEHVRRAAEKIRRRKRGLADAETVTVKIEGVPAYA